MVNTCYGTHHLVFAEDANNTLWTSGGGGAGVVGWLNTKMLEETGDEEKSQGWTALILDTNGNGKRDEYVGPNDPIDPTKDKQLQASFYGVAWSPVDGSVWGSIRVFPGQVVRLNPGSNPPHTALAEVYEMPWKDSKPLAQGYGRAAWISIVTALSGPCCRAAISRASTGASARDHSTARMRRDNIVPKAGRCIHSPDRSFRT